MIETTPFKVGDRIAERYEIHRILGGEGRSGQGIVYVVYDHEHREVVQVPLHCCDGSNNRVWYGIALPSAAPAVATEPGPVCAPAR